MKSKTKKSSEKEILLPRQNADFIGHKDAIASLRRAYDNGKLPGAWLFSGPKGIGKATLAYRLARFILSGGNNVNGSELFGDAEVGQDFTILDNSDVFAKVSANSHPDLLVLGADVNSQTKTDTILVDDAREIGNFLHLTSADTQYRIVIIDSVDDMNINASNCILKLLEEPADHCIFILVSHAPGKLLPTIRSRCRNIKMRQMENRDAAKILCNIQPQIDTHLAQELIDLASGAPGVAYDLYINNGIEIYKDILNVLASLPNIDMLKIQKIANYISSKQNEAAWRVFRFLIDKVLVDLTRHIAINGIKDQLVEEKFKLSMPIDAEKLVEVWEECNHLLQEADRLHLERRAMLVKVFTLFVRK